MGSKNSPTPNPSPVKKRPLRDLSQPQPSIPFPNLSQGLETADPPLYQTDTANDDPFVLPPLSSVQNECQKETTQTTSYNVSDRSNDRSNTTHGNVTASASDTVTQVSADSKKPEKYDIRVFMVRMTSEEKAAHLAAQSEKWRAQKEQIEQRECEAAMKARAKIQEQTRIRVRNHRLRKKTSSDEYESDGNGGHKKRKRVSFINSNHLHNESCLRYLPSMNMTIQRSHQLWPAILLLNNLVHTDSSKNNKASIRLAAAVSGSESLATLLSQTISIRSNGSTSKQL